MLRHEFQPGKLVAGLVLVGAAVTFGGDGGGLWQVPWFVMGPVLVGGLCLAGAVGTTTRRIRYRRGGARTTASAPASDPGPASSSRAPDADDG